VFGFENFSMLRFKIIFGYYEKWDFVVVIIVRTFVFVRIKFRSMNKDCVSGKKLYKFEGKFIPLQGCMFSYIYIYIYIEREREREREREYKEGILFEFLIKMMSLMGLIELIMIELG
jgi:hypothetical protein